MENMITIGNRCRQYRKNVLKVTLSDVAESTGYSKENISAFECGRNANSLILLWYISKGISVDQLMGVCPIE